MAEAGAHSLAHSSVLPPGREGDAVLTAIAAGAMMGLVLRKTEVQE